ncbi:hypothetical protein [Marinibacterium sp. SX1]|uniref:hypothetical protein n=1 Tax=Marinibacterium sp. SX1 TaxID=3388424 RepID=UPI003D166182
MSGAQAIRPIETVDLPAGQWVWRITRHPETGVAFGIHEPELRIERALISGFTDERTAAQLRRLADEIDRMRGRL